jgi:hypothetical protein
MSPRLSNPNGFATNHSELSETALPRTSFGAHRLPQIRTNWVASNAELSEAGTSQLDAIASDVANAVEQATRQYRENNSWLQLELDVWQAVTSTLEKWRRRTPTPAGAQPSARARHAHRRLTGPVRFQRRHR